MPLIIIYVNYSIGIAEINKCLLGMLTILAHSNYSILKIDNKGFVYRFIGGTVGIRPIFVIG